MSRNSYGLCCIKRGGRFPPFRGFTIPMCPDVYLGPFLLIIVYRLRVLQDSRNRNVISSLISSSYLASGYLLNRKIVDLLNGTILKFIEMDFHPWYSSWIIEPRPFFFKKLCLDLIAIRINSRLWTAMIWISQWRKYQLKVGTISYILIILFLSSIR